MYTTQNATYFKHLYTRTFREFCGSIVSNLRKQCITIEIIKHELLTLELIFKQQRTIIITVGGRATTDKIRATRNRASFASIHSWLQVSMLKCSCHQTNILEIKSKKYLIVNQHKLWLLLIWLKK